MIDEEDYLKLIKDRVDEIILRSGYGKVIVEVEIKERKPRYLIFIKSEERVSLDG